MTSTIISNPYASFLDTAAGPQWKKIGTNRRSGAAVPLFSIWSGQSIGLGELPDLKLLMDWFADTGMSVLQLLPLNDTGFNFTPYDAQSSFALDPMYLSLSDLKSIPSKSYKIKIEKLRKKFPAGKGRVDYSIKGAKLKLLWEIYTDTRTKFPAPFLHFCKNNAGWLDDYALYQIMKSLHSQSAWENWPEPIRRRNDSELDRLRKEHEQIYQFHVWMQWQLFEQFCDVRKYAAKKGILIMGDLPFLVARDSADVWAHQDYFRLDAVAGAPPDLYFAQGQRWGMPPYQWHSIERDGFQYVKDRLKYAEHFYDMYRIDHVVGMFRLWTIPVSEPIENAGKNGYFDPGDENIWYDHGKKIISVMVSNSTMLPCAEDLGVVPKACDQLLLEMAIPGMDVQRWKKDWGKTNSFKEPSSYRSHSVAVTSTHDMCPLAAWWRYEAGTVDSVRFQNECARYGVDFYSNINRLFDVEHSEYGRLRWRKAIRNKEQLAEQLHRAAESIPGLIELFESSFDEKDKFLHFLDIKPTPERMKKIDCTMIAKSLQKASESHSVFSIPLIQDWLSLDGEWLKSQNPWEQRVNTPGTMDKCNWSVVLPFSLEQLLDLKINAEIRNINQTSGRI